MLLKRWLSSRAGLSPRTAQHLSDTATRREPLRILFCGSDLFSISSLRALHEKQLRSPDIIRSIDVVCKPPKPFGRGFKNLREVEIAPVARELGLKLHQINTFTGWQLPRPDGDFVNLIVAVSFGLFVPPRILGAAKYGGLNVHPSMLPDLRGSSPLMYTLLYGLKSTGITVQTLHDKHFDHGLILAQTPAPGLPIPRANEISQRELAEFLAPIGAEMLLHVIEQGRYVSPLKALIPSGEDSSSPQRLAPKINSEDRHIDWATWTADQIIRRTQVLGSLWNKSVSGSSQGSQRRIIWSEGFRKLNGLHDMASDLNGHLEGIEVGSPFTFTQAGEWTAVYVRTVDGSLLEAKRVKFDGQQLAAAKEAFRKAKIATKVANESFVTFESLT
ncbi:Methionyl-tRNA formyltransferase [Agyrium rufum]|nr:Methionyl-tRNA formyltransferase [Agyrium rufum]